MGDTLFGWFIINWSTFLGEASLKALLSRGYTNFMLFKLLLWARHSPRTIKIKQWWPPGKKHRMRSHYLFPDILFHCHQIHSLLLIFFIVKCYASLSFRWVLYWGHCVGSIGLWAFLWWARDVQEDLLLDSINQSFGEELFRQFQLKRYFLAVTSFDSFECHDGRVREQREQFGIDQNTQVAEKHINWWSSGLLRLPDRLFWFLNLGKINQHSWDSLDLFLIHKQL